MAVHALKTEGRIFPRPEACYVWHALRDACVAGNGVAWVSYRRLREMAPGCDPARDRKPMKEAGWLDWVAWEGRDGKTIYWLVGRCSWVTLLRRLRALAAPLQIVARAKALFFSPDKRTQPRANRAGAGTSYPSPRPAAAPAAESGSARCARSPDVLASPAEPTSAAGDSRRTAQRPLAGSPQPAAAQPAVPRRVSVLPDDSPDLQPRPGERQAAYMSRLTGLYQDDRVSSELYDRLWRAAAVDWRGPGP